MEAVLFPLETWGDYQPHTTPLFPKSLLGIPLFLILSFHFYILNTEIKLPGASAAMPHLLIPGVWAPLYLPFTLFAQVEFYSLLPALLPTTRDNIVCLNMFDNVPASVLHCLVEVVVCAELVVKRGSMGLPPGKLLASNMPMCLSCPW